MGLCKRQAIILSAKLHAGPLVNSPSDKHLGLKAWGLCPAKLQQVEPPLFKQLDQLGPQPSCP